MATSSTQAVPETRDTRSTWPSSWTATAGGRRGVCCPAAGHAKGVQAVRRVVEACGRAGVRYLTLFAFSSENWRRPAEEVSC